MNDIEKALIEKCKAGDVDAFEKLICSYQKRVFNICYRYLSNYDDASETAQEVFIKIFKSMLTFKGESSFSTWIFKVTATTCIDQIRKRNKQNTLSIDEALDDEEHKVLVVDFGSNPDNEYERIELKREIRRAIEQLSEEQKMVIILRDIQGFSYDEIAVIVGIPLGTVKSRIKRAREEVKEYLMQKGNFFEKVSSN